MQYNDLVRDFARRTQANLDAIHALQAGEPFTNRVFEVTQLINSMLGLLVFPQQRFFDRIPEIPLAALAAAGWPVPEVVGSYPQVRNLKELVRYLRNALAHCNIKFTADAQNEINGLELWNTRLDRGSRREQETWRVRLTIQDLEKISSKFIELILTIEDQPARTNGDQPPARQGSR